MKDLLGIISSLAFSSDVSSGVFAAGSLSPSSPASSNLAIFTETTGEVPVMFVGDEPGGTGLGVPSSVSQVGSTFSSLRFPSYDISAR